LLATIGCEDVEPRQADGFALEQLSNVVFDMSRADVLAAMGAPLQERIARDDHGQTSALSYAEPGARWIMGEYRFNVRGYECVMWLRGGRLTAARVFNAARGTLCQCNADSFAVDRAEPCFAAVSSGEEVTR
jgi:hypothetical protein